MKIRPTRLLIPFFAILVALAVAVGPIYSISAFQTAVVHASTDLSANSPALLHPAAAQTEPITLSATRVDIWPEYDKPSVLVIYNMTLGSSVKLPANLTVRIPAAVGQPTAVAMQDASGLYNLSYTKDTVGDWVEVKFTTPMPEVRVEYYDPSLKKTGTNRDFTFRWPADYAVDSLVLQVQQPVNATNFNFRPSAGAGQVGNDGLTYYTIQAGKVNAGTTFDLALSYTKATDALSNPSQAEKAEPSQPIDGNTQGRVRLDQVLPWALIAAAVLLIAAGIFWYWRMGQMGTATQAAGRGKTRHARRSAAVETASGGARAAAEPGEPIFCHQCGKKAGPGDVFCRSCGTRLH